MVVINSKIIKKYREFSLLYYKYFEKADFPFILYPSYKPYRTFQAAFFWRVSGESRLWWVWPTITYHLLYIKMMMMK